MTSTYKKPFSGKARKYSRPLNSVPDNCSVPYTKYGRTNIENISDSEFELIKDIFDATIYNKIQWNRQGFFEDLKQLLSEKDVVMSYYGRFNGLRVSIQGNIKGYVRLKIFNKLEIKPFIDTHVSDVKFFVCNNQVGIIRSTLLGKLFKMVQYRTDGILVPFKSRYE